MSANVISGSSEANNFQAIVTTREQRLSELRNQGVRRALRFIDMGHPRAALEFIFISFEQQARAIGLRDVYLPRIDYPDDAS